MAWLEGHHSKLGRRHYFNEALPELTFCGIRRTRPLIVVTDVNKVNCGNCVALLATTTPPATVASQTWERILYMDSGAGGTITVWEVVAPGMVVPLRLNGARMQQSATLAAVEKMYGPLSPITEVELLALQYLALEQLVRENIV